MIKILFPSQVIVFLMFSSISAYGRTWLDGEAQNLGYVIIVGGGIAAWFWAGIKAADNGHTLLAWIIGLAPFVILVLSFAGAFR